MILDYEIYIYIVYNVTWSLSYFFQPFLGCTYFRSGVVSAGSSQQWFFGEDLPIWCFIIMEIPWKFMDFADLSSFSLWTFSSLWFLKLQPEPLCWQKRCKNDQNIAIFLMYPVFRQTPKKYNEGTPGIVMKQTVRWLKKSAQCFLGSNALLFFSRMQNNGDKNRYRTYKPQWYWGMTELYKSLNTPETRFICPTSTAKTRWEIPSTTWAGRVVSWGWAWATNSQKFLLQLVEGNTLLVSAPSSWYLFGFLFFPSIIIQWITRLQSCDHGWGCKSQVCQIPHCFFREVYPV